MEQNPSLETSRSSATEEISFFYRTLRFITAFTSAHKLSLPWAISIQSNPHILLPEDPS